WVLTRGSNSHALRCNAVPVEAPPNQEFVKQGSTDSQNLHVKGAQSVASWSLFLAGLVVGITVCVAIGYIVFLQPNPDSNVPNLPPSDAMVETPPDETSSTSSPSQTNHRSAQGQLRRLRAGATLRPARPSRLCRYLPKRTTPQAAPPRPSGPSTRRHRRKRAWPSSYPILADAGSCPGNCSGMEEATGAPSS